VTENRHFSPIDRSSRNEDAYPPKYYRLKHALREQIAEMKANEALPSEADLCQRFEISRTTVRKALSDLVQEGLIYTMQGKGTFVAPRKLTSAWVQQTGGLFADMSERGISVAMQVLELAVITAEENIQKALKVGEGEQVYKLRRLRFVDDQPFDVVTNYLPCRLFPGLENEDFNQRSLYSVLREKYNVRFERGLRTVEAGACPAEDARLLQIRARSPILIMHSTMYDEKGQVIEHGVVFQRSDVARIEIEVIPH
jgi:GntR family transcriptional regulator